MLEFKYYLNKMESESAQVAQEKKEEVPANKPAEQPAVQEPKPVQ